MFVMELDAQTTLWSEDFSSYSNGTITGSGAGPSSSVWNSQTGAVVNGGLILASNTVNTGASSLANPLIWSTNTININNYTNVTFSVDTGAYDTNQFEDSGGSQDNFALEYRLDGGSWTQVFSLSGSTSQPINPSYAISGLLGTTLEIRATFHTTAANENYTIDNVLVVGTGSSAPPVIIASGYQSYCAGSSRSVAETITITDIDDTTTSAAYVQISNGYINGEDLLTLTGSHPNITSTWDPVQGELSLQGPATYTEFEAAILATEFSSSSASPTGSRQFSITVGEPNFLPVTGHYYEFVSAPGISWTTAEAAATSRTYFGLQGYLVTLTSQEEADFSGQQASGFGWIGATDVAVEGEWRWVTGPESGTLFWNGLANGTEITYANWNGGEPNNAGNEDYAHIADASVIRGGAPIGAWNDLPNGGGGGAYASQGYVVEYGGMTGDPVLQISATTSLIVNCRIITNRRITHRVSKN